MVLDFEAMLERLEKLDGKRYGAYRVLRGVQFETPCGRAVFTRIQGDPYAPPSILEFRGRIRLEGLPAKYPVAAADWGYRRLYLLLRRVSRKRGTGHSGYMGVPRPTPVMIRRSGFEIHDGSYTIRVRFGLPARGRRILGTVAAEMLRKCVDAVCKVIGLVERGGKSLEKHVMTYAIQEYIRGKLPELKLVSFIGDGSILPRRCGWCEDPLPDAIPFESPPELRVEIETPWGVYSGMGIPRGFTVVVGHPFHGKTTLLEAIVAGVYNHIPGDGRERVVTIREVFWIEAEDGRPVHCRDISPLISRLPGGRNTRCFTTSDASGATSMAAAIVEAYEAGAKLIIVDEDRAATNLLCVSKEIEEVAGKAPVTPLAEYAHCLASKGVSVIIATGVLSQLMEAADTVLLVKEFRVYVLKKPENQAGSQGVCRLPEKHPIEVKPWVCKPRPPRLEGKDGYELDLTSNRVLVEDGQYATIARLLARGWRGHLDEISLEAEKLLAEGFEEIVKPTPPDLAEIRGLDLIHAMVRLPPGVVKERRVGGGGIIESPPHPKSR